MGAKIKEYSSSQEEVVMEGKTNTQVDEIKKLRLNRKRYIKKCIDLSGFFTSRKIK